MKENKGITLVALIITIIVMLILVGVTISAVVQSDIIGQGEEAARAYENKQTEEQSLNFITEGGKTIANYLNPSNEDEEDNNEDEEVPDELKLYLFGESGDGITLMNNEENPGTGIFNWENEYEPLFVNYSGILDEEPIYKGLAINGDESYLYIEYKDMIYKFAAINESGDTNPSAGITKIGAPITATLTTDVEVGSTISYDGKKWVVMYIKRN